MKEKLLDDNLVQKSIRIRGDYFKFFKYFEYMAEKNNIDKNLFLSNVISYSLNHLTENGFNYIIKPYKPRRIPKGLVLLPEVFELLDTSFNYYSNIYRKKHKKRLYVCEYVELLIYIYVREFYKDGDLDLQDGLNCTINTT